MVLLLVTSSTVVFALPGSDWNVDMTSPVEGASVQGGATYVLAVSVVDNETSVTPTSHSTATVKGYVDTFASPEAAEAAVLQEANLGNMTYNADSDTWDISYDAPIVETNTTAMLFVRVDDGAGNPDSTADKDMMFFILPIPVSEGNGPFTMTFDPESGTYFLEWQSPSPVNPEGILGSIVIGAFAADGSELVAFEGGFGMHPAERTFGFQDVATSARVRGGVVIEPADPADQTQGNLVGAHVSGDKLSPGTEYTLRIEDANGAFEELVFTADANGLGGTSYGPNETALVDDETNFTITIIGPEFGADDGVSGPGDVEPVEEEPFTPESFIDPDTGYTMTILSHGVAFEGGEPGIEVSAKTLETFEIEITDATGAVVPDAMVLWQVTFEGPEGTTPAPTGTWTTIPYDYRTNTYTVVWTIPQTTNAEGITGSMHVRVVNVSDGTELLTFDAGAAFHTAGRGFDIRPEGGERFRGEVVVELSDPNDVNSTHEFGAAFSGRDLLNPGEEYTLTVTDTQGGEEVMSFVAGPEGSGEVLIAPKQTTLDLDENTFTLSIEGPQVSATETPADVEPAEAEPAPAPWVELSNDLAFTLIFDSPAIAVEGGAPVVDGFAKDDIVVQMRLTDRDGNTVIDQRHGYELQWQANVDGQQAVGAVTAPPAPATVDMVFNDETGEWEETGSTAAVHAAAAEHLMYEFLLEFVDKDSDEVVASVTYPGGETTSVNNTSISLLDPVPVDGSVAIPSGLSFNVTAVGTMPMEVIVNNSTTTEQITLNDSMGTMQFTVTPFFEFVGPVAAPGSGGDTSGGDNSAGGSSGGPAAPPANTGGSGGSGGSSGGSSSGGSSAGSSSGGASTPELVEPEPEVVEPEQDDFIPSGATAIDPVPDATDELDLPDDEPAAQDPAPEPSDVDTDEPAEDIEEPASGSNLVVLLIIAALIIALVAGVAVLARP